ncbi:carboxyl transferase domain-containing protein [Solibaculum mannosilyticum]|uniref:Methylmalonyl-CoA carboxyltransferase n=1 Tax=Solibaculum mannosilyticum TaxID=2780922 RepID=A0A7I8CZY5_9FIRM|nr:carboxyl transferase domain-containing protein [Solibaculum mannosilyticum]BCI60080.1 methylmalonyl-CoA carboxyltransferase [Solibaculum mannosilyticum]
MSLESGRKILSEKRAGMGESPARKRLEKLFDQGTFLELDGLAAKEVVTGFGSVDGAPAYAFAQDSTVNGGAIGRAQAEKIAKVYDLAIKTGAPVVGVYDSHGAYLKEGADMMAALGDLVMKASRLSGVVPQISLIAGVCGGSAALMASMADLVVKSDKGELFLTAHEEAEKAAGVVHVEAENEEDAIASVRSLINLLPINNLSIAPVADAAEATGSEGLESVVDAGSMVELLDGFGDNVTAGLARVAGNAAVVADIHGQLDADSSVKLARMVRMADAFSLPVVTLVDCEGFDTVREAAKVAHTYAEATTPKVTVITGAAVGAAYMALAGKAAGADVVFAWPQAVVSAMKPEAAVEVLWNDKLAQMKDPLKERAQLVQEYKDTEATPFDAAEAGYIENVIEPAETRANVVAALDMLAGKRVATLPRKHSNMPL